MAFNVGEQLHPDGGEALEDINGLLKTAQFSWMPQSVTQTWISSLSTMRRQKVWAIASFKATACLGEEGEGNLPHVPIKFANEAPADTSKASNSDSIH